MRVSDGVVVGHPRVLAIDRERCGECGARGDCRRGAGGGGGRRRRGSHACSSTARVIDDSLIVGKVMVVEGPEQLVVVDGVWVDVLVVGEAGTADGVEVPAT